jgi:hypothetical protein
MRIYEMKIAQKRSEELAPVLEQQLYPVIMMSEFGDVPKDFKLKFPPLRVLTDEEKADLGTKISTSISNYFNAGIYSHKMALMDVKETSEITGIGTNISEEDIARAPDDFVPTGELETSSESEEEQSKAGDAAWIPEHASGEWNAVN